MDQFQNLADDRLVVGCIYCGRDANTRDHVPSRVFLDNPFPENLPVVGACKTCNSGFSRDEEYFACLLEAVVAGTTEPTSIRRPGIANILLRAPALKAKIESAKTVVNGQIQFAIEAERIKSVLLKLARGHAAFELSQTCRHEPMTLWWNAIHLMTEQQIEAFEVTEFPATFGEIGSRGMQRLLIMQLTLRSENDEEINLNLPMDNDWVNVQEGRYRYLAFDYGEEIVIKMVIGEYLACEVVWET